jgi:hypothetical protein
MLKAFKGINKFKSRKYRSISVTSIILGEDINVESLKGKCHFEERCSHSEQALWGKYQSFIQISV